MTEYKKFSEFAEEEKPLEGSKVKLDDILNKEVLITGFKVSESKFKQEKYLTIQFLEDKIVHVTFTGSGVLINQLTKYAEHIPFLSTIRKINKYYSLT